MQKGNEQGGLSKTFDFGVYHFRILLTQVSITYSKSKETNRESTKCCYGTRSCDKRHKSESAMNLKATTTTTTTILFLVVIILSEAWEVTSSSLRKRSKEEESGKSILKENETKYHFGSGLGRDGVSASRNLHQALPPFPPRTAVAQRRTKGDDKKGKEDDKKDDNVDEKNTDRNGQSSSSSSIPLPVPGSSSSSSSGSSCVPLTVWLKTDNNLYDNEFYLYDFEAKTYLWDEWNFDTDSIYVSKRCVDIDGCVGFHFIDDTGDG